MLESCLLAVETHCFPAPESVKSCEGCPAVGMIAAEPHHAIRTAQWAGPRGRGKFLAFGVDRKKLTDCKL